MFPLLSKVKDIPHALIQMLLPLLLLLLLLLLLNESLIKHGSGGPAYTAAILVPTSRPSMVKTSTVCTTRPPAILLASRFTVQSAIAPG